MSEDPSGSWTPTYDSQSYSTFTPTGTQTPFSPSRYTYTSNSARPTYDDADSYYDEDSLEEVEATLNSMDDEITQTEDTLTHWSQGQSYTPSSSYTGTGTYTGTYTGSTSYVTLPTARGRTPQPADPRIRLSRITERTEESRPASGAFSTSRPANPTQDVLRKSTLLPPSPSSGHSRSATDPGADKTLPPPGHATKLIAVFESQGGGHSKFPSAPGRSASPFAPSGSFTTTGYGYGSTSYGYGSGSRPSSPSKSSGSSGSYTATDTRHTYSSMLSPPIRTSTSDFTRTASHFTPSSYTQTPTQTDTITHTYTNTRTGTDTITGANTGTITSASYTDTGSTFTPTSLRRPQHSPRSPLASVKNLVSAWRERDPQPRPTDGRPSGSNTTTSPPLDSEGLIGIGRRFRRAGARLRESGGLRPFPDPVTPKRNSNGNDAGGSSGNGSGSIRSRRSGVLPSGIDLGEFSPYIQSNAAPLYIGLLWYLNVHAAPPYRWQRCQALLYPHMLLLSWLAPGGGRGIVALDLLNCTDVQQAYSPSHPNARDDIGTVAARIQSAESDGQPLVDMLVPFQMMYADGVERLAAESLLERQKWVNRISDAVNRPLSESQRTRSPTGSIRTILSVDSRSSSTSVGSRSTVFVPPLSTMPDIADYHSETSPLTRHLSISSHHTGTVDDTVIRNDHYVYPGDRRAIVPSRGNSLRRSGSMTDMDSEFRSALDRARGGREGNGNTRRLFEYSPVSVSSGSSLGKDVYVTPPPSTRGGDRNSRGSDEAFFSASSNGARSNLSSTYYSQTEWTGTGTGTGYDTTTGLQSGSYTQSSTSQTVPSTYDTNPTSYTADSRDDSITFSSSQSTLSRARAVNRRIRGTARSETSTSTYTAELSNKENGISHSSYTPTDSASQSQTAGSSTFTPGSGSNTMDSGTYTPGSGTQTGTYTPGSNSYTGTYTPSTQSGSHTPSSRTESYTTGSGSGSGSYTPGSGTGSYTASGSGSGSYTMSGPASSTGAYTPGSGSGSGSGSYTPGSLTYGSGSYTSGSMTYGQSSGSSTGISNSFTQGTESGYDICQSSDLDSLTRTTYTTTYGETLTPPTRSIISGATRGVAPTIPFAGPSKLRRLSRVSSGYLTAEEAPSTASSPASFKSLSTIPPESEYATADAGSTAYKTASEPPTETEFYTASQMRSPSDLDVPGEVPEDLEPEQEVSSGIVPPTPLSSVAWSDDDRSLINIPTPSEIPSISSPQSTSELLPEEIPLPPTEASFSPVPSFPSSSESIHVPTPSSLPATSLPTESQLVSTSDTELLSSLPPTTSTLESESVITPSSFEASSEGTPRSRSLPPIPVTPTELESELEISLPSAPSQVSSSADAPTPSSLPISSPSSLTRSSPLGTPWARETSLSYDSSILQPSPSLRSLAAQELSESSYDPSLQYPSVSSPSSVSSLDRLSTIPPSPSPLTSLIAASPLPSLTTVPRLSPSEVSPFSDAPTPSDFTFSSEPASEVEPVVRPSTAAPSTAAPSTARPPTAVPWSPTGSTGPSLATAPSPASFSIPAPSPIQSLASLTVPTPSEISSSFLSESELASSAPSLAHSGEEDLLGDVGREAEIVSSPPSLADTNEEEALGGEAELPLEGEDETRSEISTEPSLLTTPPGSVRSGSATPIPSLLHDLPSLPSSPSPSAPESSVEVGIETHEGSGEVSMSTPEGSVQSTPGTLLTESSESVVASRDIGQDIDRLADDLRRYNDTRGDENRNLSDGLQALRDELRDLSDFLHRTPSPRQPIIIREAPPAIPPQSIPRIVEQQPGRPLSERPIIYQPLRVERSVVSQGVGSDNVMTEEIITMDGRVRDSSVTVARSNSNASTVSFLSSHHSDDSVLEGSEAYEPSIEEIEDWAPSTEGQPRYMDIEESEISDDGDESQLSTSSFTSSLETSSKETSTLTVTPDSTPTPSTPTPQSTPTPIPTTSSIRISPESIATTSSLSTISTPTVRPRTQLVEPSLDTIMDSLRGQLNDMRDQLRGLWNGQSTANSMLDMLRARPTPLPTDNTEIENRLHRIEDLMQDLIEQNRSREHMVPPPPPPPPPVESEPAESIITTSDSLADLREQLESFAPGRPPLRMPVPSQAMPSILQQLQQSILSGLPPATANRPPPLQPFVFEPRQSRPRSASPITFEARASTVPPVSDFTLAEPLGTGAVPIFRRRRRTEEAGVGSPTSSTAALDRALRMPPEPAPFRTRPDYHQAPRRLRTTLPPPAPVFTPPDGRSRTTPPEVRDTRPRGWYHPSRQRTQQEHPQPSAPSEQRLPRTGEIQQPPSTQAPPQAPSGPERVFMPMPPGPVQLPPVFNSLMEMLRDNRAAHDATVTQQRELMRYMSDLNNWLERDVGDRQAEIRGVNARIENLRRELNDLFTAGRSASIASSVSSEIRSPPTGQIPPRATGYPPGPMQYAPYPQHQAPGTEVVIPPAIETTPSPTFAPVIPPPPQQEPPQNVVIPQQLGPPPLIPLDGLRQATPRQTHTPMPRPESPPIPFIPPPMDDFEGERPQMIRPPVHRIRPSSSTSSSTFTHSSESPRRHPSRSSRRTASTRSRRSASVSSSASDSSSTESPRRRRRGSRRSHTATPRTHGSDLSYAPQPTPAPSVVIPPRRAPSLDIIPVSPPHPVSRMPSTHISQVPSTHPAFEPQPQPQPQPQLAPQPTIILQQPGPPVQQPGPPVQPPTHYVVSPQPGPSVGPSVYPPPPIVIQHSRSSSSSSGPSLRTRRSSSAHGRSRSHSRPHSPSYHDFHPTTPSHPSMVGQPQPPIIIRHSSSRSRSPPQSHYTPVTPTSQPPILVQPPTSQPQQPPVIIQTSRSRSRSSSPSYRLAPVPVPSLPTETPQVPLQPTIISGVPQPQAQLPVVPPPQQPPVIIHTSRSRSPSLILRPGTEIRTSSPSRRYSSPPLHYPPPRETRIIPSGRSRSRSPPIVVTHPSSRRGRSPSDYYPPSSRYSPHRDDRGYRSRSRTPDRGSGRRGRPRESERSPRRRSRSRDSRRDSRSPSGRYDPMHRRPSDVYPERGRPPRTTERYPSSRRESSVHLSRSTSSPSQVGIVVAPPSRRDSIISHRPPTALGFDHPEIIHPHRTPPSRAHTPHRVSESGRYSPTLSDYGTDDGRHVRSPVHRLPGHPIIPASPSQTPTVLETGAPIIPVPPSRTPTIRDGYHPVISVTPTRASTVRRHEDDRGATPGRRPSERRSEPEQPPTGHIFHEVPSEPSEAQTVESVSDMPLPIRPPQPLTERSRSPVSVIHPSYRRESITPLDLGDAEIEQRNNRLAAIENHLHDVALAAEQAEDKREEDFRQNEEHRQRIFLEGEDRREQDNRERAERLWNTIESTIDSRLHALPPARPPSDRPPSTEILGPEITPGHPAEDEGVSAAAEHASIRSIKSVVERVTSLHSQELLETVSSEREQAEQERRDAAAERERQRSEAEEIRKQLQEAQESRIQALEQELADTKAELQRERGERLTEEADLRERERAECVERDNSLRQQISELTDLLQETRHLVIQKKDDSDNRYAEKQQRREDKEIDKAQLLEAIRNIQNELQAEIERSNEERLNKPDLNQIIEDLRSENAAQRELLRSLSDEWRNECKKHHEETIEAVKSTAREQVPFNVQGYLDEFSKALAAEVRMLLGEVGKLREERRNLQHEMGFLLCMKSKYGPGGEFQPDWRPASAAAPPEPPAPPPEVPPDLPPPAAKPGWRQIGKRKGRKKDMANRPPPPPQVPVAPVHHIDPRRQVESWTTWQPDPNFAPSTPDIEPSLVVPRVPSPGLFGTRTPSWSGQT